MSRGDSLEVFDGVDIPVDLAATQKYVTLGASDSGKTFMLARFAEQCADHDIFFVLLDPVGKHWSLRAGPNGKPKGGKRDIWVLGGLHGDTELDPKSGELIADTVVDHPGRYVLDVSQFETDQDVYNFAAAFARRLFRRKAKDPGWPMLLMLEEAEWFLPQQPQAGQQVMKGAFGRIVRQGRNHGLGIFLVFQRSAAGDKGAISQCKVLIAKQMSHNRDLDAVDEWVSSNGTKEQRDEMMAALASMDVKEAFVWSPSWLRVFKRTLVLPRETFDSSANVKHGERMARVELTPLDVDALGKRITALAEKAKADDPKELRKRIATLERELAKRPTEEVVRTETEYVDVPVLDDAHVKRLEDALEALGGVAGKVIGAGNEIAAGLGKLKMRAPAPAPGRQPVSAPVTARQRPPAPAPARAAAPPRDPAEGLTGPQQRVLDAIAWLNTVGFLQPSKLQVGFIAGYRVGKKVGGTYGAILGALRGEGLIDYVSSNVVLTDAGSELAAPADIEQTTAGLQAAVYDRLDGPERRVLEVLVDVYPDALPKQELGARAGYQVSEKVGGTFGNILGKLGSGVPAVGVMRPRGRGRAVRPWKRDDPGS